MWWLQRLSGSLNLILLLIDILYNLLFTTFLHDNDNYTDKSLNVVDNIDSISTNLNLKGIPVLKETVDCNEM